MSSFSLPLRGKQTREELVAAAGLERKARAEERQRRDAALLVQRVFRGRRVAAAARKTLLAEWEARFGGVQASNVLSMEEVELHLLPPLFLVARGHRGRLVTSAVGGPVLARAFALLLASGRACELSNRQAAAAVALAASVLAQPPSSPSPAVLAAVSARLLATVTANADASLSRACLLPASLALETLLLTKYAEEASVTAVAAVLLRCVRCDDALLSSEAAAALASLLRTPATLSGLLAAQLARTDTLLPLLMALSSPNLSTCNEASSAWATAHAAQLFAAASAPSCALATAFLAAVQAQRGAFAGGSCALLRASALSDAAAALQAPGLLSTLLAADVPLDALCAFYWPMLASDAEAGADALRLRNTLAFSAQLLLRLWPHAAGLCGCAPALPDGDAPADVAGWAPKTLARAPWALLPPAVAALGVFAVAFEHLLVVLDDAEMHEQQTPLRLDQSRAATAAVNALVVGSHSVRGAATPGRARLLAAATKLLRALHARDERRRFAPPGLWLAPAAATAVAMPAAARALAACDAPGDGLRHLLSAAPHCRPFAERVAVFRHLCASDRAMHHAAAPPMPLTVRRSHLLEDALAALGHRGGELRGRVFVRFLNAQGLPEAGIDHGGLSKELVTELVKTLFDPRRGLFCATHAGLLHVTPAAAASQEGRVLLQFAGLVVGKALYDGILLDVSLAPFFVAGLLRRPLTLDDLPSLDPALHRSLLAVKRYQGDVSQLCLDFTASTDDGSGGTLSAELMPRGAEVAVSNDNRLGYVAAVAEWRLAGLAAQGVGAFRAGLACCVAPHWLALFSPSELNSLLSGGAADFDVRDLRAHCVLQGYGPGSRTVALFFEVLAAFSPAQRAALLKFTTSVSRPPFGGFKHLQPPFTLAKVAVDVSPWSLLTGGDVERLPSASTCFCRLNLPNYRRKGTMRAKLLLAIESGSGFDLS